MTISPGGTRREVDGHHGDAFRSSYAAPHVVSDGHHIDSRASRVVHQSPTRLNDSYVHGGTTRVVSDGHHLNASRVVSSGYDHGVTRVISDGHHVDARASRVVSSGYDHGATRVVSSGNTGYSSEGRVELTIKSANFFKDSDTWGK